MTQRNALKLPEHTEPGSSRTASAPYNFVPLPEMVVKAVESAGDLPDHSAFTQDGHTRNGYLDVTLTTLSPLYIRAPLTLEEFDRREKPQQKEIEIEKGKEKDEGSKPFAEQVKNKPDFFYTDVSKQPVLPGSSLRGMLRALVEIVSYGKVPWVTDSLKVFYRAVAAPKDDPLSEPYRQIMGSFGRNVQAGYLTKRGGDWYVIPAKRPADEGWPAERGSYLKVKQDQIPDDAIPGFLRFSAPKYAPQYHNVSFNARVEKGNRGTSVTLIGIGPGTAGYAHKGVLVCSGNMRETGGEDKPFLRTTHALVLDLEKGAKPLRINAKSIADYLDALTPFQKQPPFDEYTGCLQEGRPVFYVADTGEVLFFGHSPNFRVPAIVENAKKEKHAASPLDFVPPDLRRPEDIDYAEAIFGFVRTSDEIKDMVRGGLPEPPQGSKGRAYAGRVFVTDARLVAGQKEIWLSEQPNTPQTITPRILASPKPTAFQHYLVQGSDEKRALKHYDSPSPAETVIRGHKLYWHQGERGIEDLAEQSPAGPGDTQHTQFQPLDKGVHFTFRVYFENLSDQELGALCWALHPLGDQATEYRHSLGMGKPLGMGAVKLEASLHLIDRPRRYAKLFNDQGAWETGEKDAPLDLTDHATLEGLTRAFESQLLGELKPQPPCDHLYGLKRIATLLKLMEWPGCPPEPGEGLYLSSQERPNTRYMELGEYRERPVLPTPAAFGGLTGSSKPAVTGGSVPLAGPTVQNAVPRRRTVTERVTLLENVKNDKARVRVQGGLECVCSGFPPAGYGAPREGERCKAAVTYRDGCAEAAVYKGK